MFSNYLDYENFGNLSQREKSRYKQAQSYLDANPQFEERFLGLTERYPELPPVMLKDLAETNVDLGAILVAALSICDLAAPGSPINNM